MKSVIIIAAFCLVSGSWAISDAEMDKFLQHKDECISETKVDPGLIEKAKKGDFEPDEALACFASCIMQKMQVMSPDMAIDMNKAISMIPDSVDKAKAEEVLKKCAEAPGTHHCVKAGNVMKCIMDHKDTFFS